MKQNSGNKSPSKSRPKAKAFDAFYKTSRGRFLESEISHSLSVNWKKRDAENCHILIVGYPVAALLKGLKKAQSLTVFFPKGQGKKRVLWKTRNVSMVGDPAHPPFLKGSYNAAFVFHGLEYMEDPRSFLEELWRVLSPDGKLMIMVPNRAGGWRRSGVPGQAKAVPLSYRKTMNLLQDAGFSPVESHGVFYGLPMGFFRKLLFSKVLKTLSGGSIAGFPGFLIFEAEKDNGPKKIKLKDPLKAAPGVKTAPEFIPE